MAMPTSLDSEQRKPSPLGLGKFDLVFMNPPFGTQKTSNGIDMKFLRAGLALCTPAGAVYSLHKTSTRAFIAKTAEAWGVTSRVVAELSFEIPRMYKHHKHDRSAYSCIHLTRLASHSLSRPSRPLPTCCSLRVCFAQPRRSGRLLETEPVGRGQIGTGSGGTYTSLAAIAREASGSSEWQGSDRHARRPRWRPERPRG